MDPTHSECPVCHKGIAKRNLVSHMKDIHDISPTTAKGMLAQREKTELESQGKQEKLSEHCGLEHSEEGALGRMQDNTVNKLSFPNPEEYKAHFSRTDVPTDYRTDMRSVLDQCVRILQAMRDVCQLNGWLSTALRITILQQMCHTGRWHDDHPLLCLPHLKIHDAERIVDRSTIPLLQHQFGVENAQGTDDVEKRAKNTLFENTTLEETEIKEVVRALCRWPILTISGLRLSRNAKELRIDDEDRLQLERNTSYKLQFHIDMLGPGRVSDATHILFNTDNEKLSKFPIA
ncbi:Sec63 domain protein [Ostertagia ostertagi]